jgi:hypothetical protein
LLLEFGVSPLDGAPSGDVVEVPWLSPVPNPLLSYIPPELGVNPDMDCSADSHGCEVKPVELEVSKFDMPF